MQKITYLIFLVLLSYGISAQYVDRSFFKAGFHASITLGDATDIADFGVGLDLYQHWGVSKKIDLGIATGVQYFFGLDSTEDIGSASVTTVGEDTIYTPIAALFRFYPVTTINLGGDIGYAIGLNDFTEGGFYYRPTISFDLSPSSALSVSYIGIEGESFLWSTVTGGVVFRF